MIAVLQRVKNASVLADGEKSGECKAGLLILLGVSVEDCEEDARLLAEKISKLRIFSDENDKLNLSLVDIGGEALVVSNFTLNANYSHGNRPDYLMAARPEQAEPLYEYFVSILREKISHVGTGVFGASMEISTVCDGPITIAMDSNKFKRRTSK